MQEVIMQQIVSDIEIRLDCSHHKCVLITTTFICDRVQSMFLEVSFESGAQIVQVISHLVLAIFCQQRFLQCISNDWLRLLCCLIASELVAESKLQLNLPGWSSSNQVFLWFMPLSCNFLPQGLPF